jgi:hypothetical protein
MVGSELPGRGVGDGFWYRVGQFFQGFSARVDAGERQLAAELLPPAALPLFERMPVDAQRHSLNVLYDVQAAGFHDADLCAAALLHDAGKIYEDPVTGATASLGLWWRGPLVVLEYLVPDWLIRWASPNGAHGWRHLLYLHLHHPQVGASAARAAGCSQTTCRLIDRHQDLHVCAESPRFLELLRVLQWADSRN